MEGLKMNPSILIATPGRLIDFINRGLIKFEELKVIVLD
jgi:superfamily II DNA/RNA helicase